MSAPLDIAIVGLAGCFAGARNARVFWRNIIGRVDAVTDGSAEWTGPYLDDGPSRNDRTYVARGGFLRDLAEVDPLEFGLPPAQCQGADPDHLLALKHAREALLDAGYLGSGRLPDPERTGVVIGRGTYGNCAMANVMSRLLFLDQAVEMARSLRPDLGAGDLEELRRHLEGQLAPYTGDTVAVTTPNVIAGLIANRLNLMGPNYIVDAACASALFALEAAARELTAGHCDLMVTGAVQAHVPVQLYVQFSQIQALSRGRIRPFDRGADGILLGEGVGMLVLKRVADAQADGDRIYAVIKGIGLASDGKAKGLLAPRAEGQLLAMRNAYARSGVDPRTVDLIEAHGTGTEVGDRTEIEVLKEMFAGRGSGPQIAVGSVKSMIGHCLPAAGAASLIKTALALHQRILPPTLCDEPNEALFGPGQPLYVNTQPRPWIHGGPHPRRAGVNAFGFGGANAHVILEEYVGQSSRGVQEVMGPAGATVVTFVAPEREALARQAQSELDRLRADPSAPVVRTADDSVSEEDAYRLAVVASGADEVAVKLSRAVAVLNAATLIPPAPGPGIFIGTGRPAGKVCFLFPGKGVYPGVATPYPGMLADLCMRFPSVRECFDALDRSALASGLPPRGPLLCPAPGATAGAMDVADAESPGGLNDPDPGFECTFAASLALLQLVEESGLCADAMLGYGAGQLTALVAARRERPRVIHDDDVRRVRQLAALLKASRADPESVTGGLLFADALWPEVRQALLQKLAAPGSQILLVADNCPNQVTLFAPMEVACDLKAWLERQGSIATLAPLRGPAHTPHAAHLVRRLREQFRDWTAGPLRVPLYSARSGAPVVSDARSAKMEFLEQWEHPVQFTDTIRRLYDDGFRVFLEIGPGSTLTDYVHDTLADRGDVTAVGCDSRGRPSLRQFHLAIAELFAIGIPMDLGRLLETGAHPGMDAARERPASRRNSTIKLPLRMPHIGIPPGWRVRP